MFSAVARQSTRSAMLMLRNGEQEERKAEEEEEEKRREGNLSCDYNPAASISPVNT